MQDRAVEAPASTAVEGEDLQKMLTFVTKLKGIIENVEPLRKKRALRHTESSVGDPAGSSLMASPSYLDTVNAALDEVVSFLESPWGKTAYAVAKNYYDEIWDLAINFTQVTAGVIVVNLFLGIADELLLTVREDEFLYARKRVEKSIMFVNETLPKIAKSVEEAGTLLRDIRTSVLNEEEMEKHITDFKETIKLAKLYISQCDIRLKSSDAQIEQAMNKIAVHMKANGMIRGAFMTAGGFGIYYLFRNKTVNLPTAVAMGLAGLLLLFARVRPRYQEELKDFLEYKSTQEDLRIELDSLNDLLKLHEDSFNANFPK